MPFLYLFIYFFLLVKKTEKYVQSTNSVINNNQLNFSFFPINNKKFIYLSIYLSMTLNILFLNLEKDSLNYHK